jgi:hypothetical protein
MAPASHFFTLIKGELLVKKFNLLTTLPALTLVCTLVACGGGSDSSSVDPGPQVTASVVDCFTVPTTVNFSLAVINLPPNLTSANRVTAGPMTYNGQAVTGYKSFYPNESSLTAETTYWRITNEGVLPIATVSYLDSITESTVFPRNMTPGQTITGRIQDQTGAHADVYYTLVGFEEVRLASKIFSNACHIRYKNSLGASSEVWYAPGYGNIKTIYSNGSISQYNGDI